ncbi:MAG: hypothetical protein ABIK77_06815 [candidate division WOR-3 bacterium]|uniref:Uncharacterized protein n=1 Tax=candidate division WOR-3 bacterium TaxID=2052148 RepID=A0A7V4FD24_UNCW3
MKKKGVRKLGLLFGLLFFFFAYGDQDNDGESVPFKGLDDKWDLIDKGDKLIFEPHFDWAYRLIRLSRYQVFLRMGILSVILNRLIKLLRGLLKQKEE